MTERITAEQVRHVETAAYERLPPSLKAWLRRLATQMEADEKRFKTQEEWIDKFQNTAANTAVQLMLVKASVERLKESLRVQRDLLEYATRIEKDGRELDVMAFIHNINVALGEVQYTPEEIAILERERQTESEGQR